MVPSENVKLWLSYFKLRSFAPSQELHRLGGCGCVCAISQDVHGKWWHFALKAPLSHPPAPLQWLREIGIGCRDLGGAQEPAWGLIAELSSLPRETRHLHTPYFPNNLPSPGFPHVSGAAQTHDLPVLPSGCLTISSESIRLPQLWSSSRQRATRRSGISLISSNNGLLVHSWFSYDFNGTAFPVGFFCMKKAWSQRTFVASKIWRGCRYTFLILEVSFSLFRGEHHCQ